MHSCTRQCHHVNYFAINVRYADERKNYTKTLAIRDTEAQYSNKFLTQLVKDELQDNGVQILDHVLCIITDNTFNMVTHHSLLVIRVKQLNERPREGSNSSEKSAAEILE